MRSQLIDIQENGSSLVMKGEARLQGGDRVRPSAYYGSVMVKKGKKIGVVALEE